MSDSAVCGQCGTKNVEGSRFCAGCGATLSESWARQQEARIAPPPPVPAPPERPMYAPPPPSYRPPISSTGSSPQNQRAVISLCLGIGGFLFCGPFTSVPGMILGKMEMKAIQEGRSPKESESLAKAGFYVSLGVTILWGVALIFILMATLIPILLAIFSR